MTSSGNRPRTAGQLPRIARLFVERARVGGSGLIRWALRQGSLSLPRNLVHRRPSVHMEPVELPAAVALYQSVIASADAEDEVGAVVGVPLNDLEETAHPRAFGH